VNAGISRRFGRFITGREICNGFSEQNNPEDQAARFQEESKAKDADYVKALEYGLPHSAGDGIGTGRFVMLFTNSRVICNVIFSAVTEGVAVSCPSSYLPARRRGASKCSKKV
jgi:lysyl-tRNA synthetase class 2